MHACRNDPCMAASELSLRVEAAALATGGAACMPADVLHCVFESVECSLLSHRSGLQETIMLPKS
jgi:hypothetical protein